ncbi:helix-turn-helix domain-containing protein [Subtercola vilae]|uniref:helix-turn-helix domain-containing protein n=1 Tax=Subtercola vilae TaxID=2056433 RepID=UPI00191FA256|nr:XRE family transcriptional regulator [Subtercola vilae]
MVDSSLADLGPRLKSWRQKRGLTLDELSVATDISASTLSRLESGKRAPNLELVVPIARALRLELDDLVPRAAPDPRIHGAERRANGMVYVPLSPESAPVQTVKVTMPALEAGGHPLVADPRTHDGYEWLYVLDGELRLVLGEHDLVMGAGEAAEFDTRTPHWMSAAGPTDVNVLMIFSKQGQRIHLRARPGPRSAAAVANPPAGPPAHPPATEGAR